MPPTSSSTAAMPTHFNNWSTTSRKRNPSLFLRGSPSGRKKLAHGVSRGNGDGNRAEPRNGAQESPQALTQLQTPHDRVRLILVDQRAVHAEFARLQPRQSKQAR